MAFIVEMAWGRPHHSVIYELDSEGELYPAKTVPNDGPLDPEWRFFSCHGDIWSDTLELGRHYGWEPSGSVCPDSAQGWARLSRFDNSYEPEDWLHAKQFLANDASGLADALQAALQENTHDYLIKPKRRAVLISSGMTQSEFEDANQPTSAKFLAAFIGFLRKGTFKFAWDD